MTEHFTREEAFAVADASGMLDCKLADFETTLQAFANATVDAIDKKREAQGPIGYMSSLTGSFCSVLEKAGGDLPSHFDTPFYTHALPAP